MDKPKVLFGALLVHAWVRSSHRHECASQPNNTHTHAVYNDNSNQDQELQSIGCLIRHPSRNSYLLNIHNLRTSEHHSVGLWHGDLSVGLPCLLTSRLGYSFSGKGVLKILGLMLCPWWSWSGPYQRGEIWSPGWRAAFCWLSFKREFPSLFFEDKLWDPLTSIFLCHHFLHLLKFPIWISHYQRVCPGLSS